MSLLKRESLKTEKFLVLSILLMYKYFYVTVIIVAWGISMVYESAVLSHIGCGRKNNEDNYYLNGIYRQDVNKDISGFSELQARKKILAGVFDGAGGADYGERASLMAASSLSEYQGKFGSEVLKKEYLPYVNHMIHCEMQKKSCSMGTTMALLYLDNNSASVYNIGDSRVYLIRDGRLLQITYDHVSGIADSNYNSYKNNLKNVTKEEASSKHMLVKYLGMRNNMELTPYYKENISVMQGDIFIACSDGLYNVVSNNEIIKKLAKLKDEPSDVITKELVGEALLAGGKDNITCIVVKTVEFGY